ncbi:hypothetical protein [uncultured Dysosmobacter sp.]|uniref:hypothetical protein n=1 Tax=uncultured Dysosmobacter sp. TaxID=2591384 RepID=UPI00262A6F38|nr:hypothetical protein [uncultured Dysosmobacter sp.]
MTTIGAGLLLEEEDNGCFSVILHYADGTEEHLPAATPAEALITAVETDYSDYRREIKRLWTEYPLFEEHLDIPTADLEDFVAEALLLPSLLHVKDPVGFFVLGEFLHQSLQMEDDGSASFLLKAGQQILRILEEPIRTQIYLRNIFEMTFDGMERTSQRERFEKLRSVYPDVARLCDPALLDGVPESGRVFSAHNLLGLYLLELALYFHQDKQRITRCEYCWGYFIPKTKKATRYCDRVIDGFPCKQRGSRFQRNEGREKDEALLVCKQLRDRMYARFLRYKDALPEEHSRLVPMDYSQYDSWSENARLARMEYLRDELTAEEFLRKIDTTHELKSYETGKAELAEETVWQRRVASDLTFDPESCYPKETMCLDLSPRAKGTWELVTRDGLRRHDQRGHQSLREKYGKA